MSATTTIEWCDHTFNPWIGCTKVSPACDHCYAEAMARRYGWATWGPAEPRKLTSEANWRKPIAWNRAAAAAGIRRRVFCASLADVFDAEVPATWRARLFGEAILATPALDWLLLTKRPQVAAKWFAAYPAPPNVWLGTTVEDQAMANLRIPILMSIEVSTRFLSCEPLLGPINLHGPLASWATDPANDREHAEIVDWIIAGGESGPRARPSHPDWFRSLRDQCAAAAVPFFFKQWGEWAPIDVVPGGDLGGDMRRDKARIVKPIGENDGHFRRGDALMGRVGKKRAGAMLDGREWRQFPS